MKVGLCQKIEHAIAHEAIKGLLADDFKVSVFDNGQTMLKHSTDAAVIEAAMFTTDEDQLHVEYQHVIKKGRVLFIYGNDGHDVTVDRTINSELLFKGAFELADKTTNEDPVALARVLTGIGA